MSARSVSVATTLAVALAGCASVPPPARLETFNVGRNAAGETCLAARSWNDPGAPDAFARAYAITCSSAAANRPLGTVRVVADTPAAGEALEAQFDCAAEQAVTLNGAPATARRCLDRVTGLESVRIDQRRGAARFVAAAVPSLLGQAEEALAIVSGTRAASADVTRVPAATLDLAALPVRAGAPAVPVVAGEPGALNVGSALAQGIDLNHKGLHTEASRVLNDAISRLPEDASAATRAELELEAALADSNILFPDAARGHFATADRVMADTPAARTAFIQRKRDTYLALDALNRGAFREALGMLDRVAQPTAAAANPLADPNTLRLLNQPRANDARALAVPDAARLSQLVLDAQAQNARSVALLSLGDVPGATQAADRAAAIYRPLSNEQLEQGRLLWLGARIARQRGRLLARQGKYDDALGDLTQAVDLLRRGALANGGTGNEPAIAEAELERAAVFARTGASREAVRTSFDTAVDAVIASGATSLGRSIGMEDYLDLLVAEANAPRADTFDRFLRAMQASGEPAVARQLTQLRSIVAADPAVGQAVRERENLEREIARLRYALSTRTPEATTSVADMERARDAAEARLLAVDATLARDPRYRQVSETPATLAELRRALKPGEAYLKLTELDRRVYGMVVTANRAYIYHVAESAAAKGVVDQLATQLRGTIDGDLAAGKLVPFDEARAYTLFRLVSGPAATELVQARSIAVDPAGPLKRVPLAVLVTRYDANAPKADPFDFSRSAFLAGSASISTALSPRSFLVARTLPPSRAPRGFIGLGEHVPPAMLPVGMPAREVPVGFACSVDYARLAGLSRMLKPISRRELGVAADALGITDANLVTGTSFTDTGVEARDDLSQFEVVHFATHGLEEGMWGCTRSPPALVTSFGEGASDGLLSFSEIAGLRLDANLVVLSACDTASGVRDEALARASGQEEAGFALEGLVRAFFTANARAVLATYWQVSAEQESEAFIRAFYAGARTGTIGDALQGAQRTLIAQPAYSHPFYWAPYFLVGDSSKTALTPVPQRVAAR